MSSSGENNSDLKVTLLEAMANELGRDAVDSYKMAEIANALIDLDPNNVRFTVDATHVQRLGRELVARQETALSELIKNAFDADATVVLVNIEAPTKSDGGTVTIQDDGLGMGLPDLKNGWMRISTDSKVDQDRSSRYWRLRAGKKGIGRFAVERLGRHLSLKTSSLGETKGWRIDFAWDEQFTRGRELGSIQNAIVPFDKSPDEHGTTLIIRDLRDRWDEKGIRAAWKAVLLLQSPVEPSNAVLADATDPLTRAPNAPAGLRDPGFQVFIDLRDAKAARTELSLEDEFSKLAIADVDASVDIEGNVSWSVSSAKLNFHEKEERKEPDLAGLGPSRLRFRYLIYHTETMPGMKILEANKLGRELGGIRLYRNGFRVSPYGEEGNDWLSLASDSARRVILVPANNHNFIGHVEVTSADNPGLEETASREGLIENEEYRKLVKFVRIVAYWTAKRIGAVRERKVTSGQKDFAPAPRDSLTAQINRLTSTLTTSTSKEDVETAVKEILAVTEEFENQVELDREQSLKYEAMLRILASLGLSIAVFSHEVEGSTSLLNASLNNLSDSVDLLGEQAAHLGEGLTGVRTGASRVSELAGYLTSLTTKSGSRTMRTLVAKTIVESFYSQFLPYLQGLGIDFELKPVVAAIRTCPMNRSEVDSILFNFLSNSIKALKRSSAQPAMVRLSVEAEGNFVLMKFQDNGDGISERDQAHIFDAFFTTTGDEMDETEGGGTGLGLKIVSDIANSYGGTVKLGSPDKDMVTSLEVRLPAFDPSKHSL